jgi:ketosteroid isomerase-like protein
MNEPAKGPPSAEVEIDNPSGENLLRAEYETRASDDIDAFARLLTEDVLWHGPGDSAIAGVYRGVDDVVAYVRVRQSLTGGTFCISVEDMVANGRLGCVLVSASAEIGGELEWWRAHGLYRFRDGRIAECRVVPEDQREFDRIWAEETVRGRG